MGDFITFSLILCNKYISLDNKKKSLKILLFSITLQRKANLYQLFFACLQEKKKYIYISDTYITDNCSCMDRGQWKYSIRRILLWHKNFYDYLHQTFLGHTVQKVTKVTITQSMNYGILPAFRNNKLLLYVHCPYLPYLCS